jgi:hypothetical protein
MRWASACLPVRSGRHPPIAPSGRLPFDCIPR